LVDTNVLLGLTNRRREHYQLCQDAIDHLRSHDCLLHFTLQNAAEFWNVSTRPIERNGHGLSIPETAQALDLIEHTMTLLPDTAEVYAVWRDLCRTQDVCGVQVHDAKLAASMEVHGVSHILTFNHADFTRYPKLQAMHPASIRS
jgi:predicted nucleic acid-binding protein